ncbi:MAG TPA: serine acetyltransferase [Paludibacteraceae bacterium]|nr:serine acetyltransferase [Paludibacteraceae bacterium]
MTYGEFCDLLSNDFERFIDAGSSSSKMSFVVKIFFSATFSQVFLFRLGSYLNTKNNLFAKIFNLPVKFLYEMKQRSTGIQLPLNTEIDGGVRFFHYNCVIIAKSTVVGKNCSIHQGVTLGRVFNGEKAGCPVIGNNVVIFPGAMVIGNIRVGDHSVIGANAVVVNDVPDGCVVGGVPAKVLSYDSHTCFDEEWSRIFKY